MNKFEILCQNMTQRYKVSEGSWENGIDRLAQHKVATNIQFVKNTLSGKCNQIAYACIGLQLAGFRLQ